jgi:hypothetical protein
MPTQFLSQKQLAQRWALSHRTLERWRQNGKGPEYFKFEGKVAYRLSDILTYEAGHMHRPSSSASGALAEEVGIAGLTANSFAGGTPLPSVPTPSDQRSPKK